MFKEERHEFIFNILSKNKKVSVNELSNLLNISKETIRSDLKYMDNSGRIKRCHGGAIINNKTSGVNFLDIDLSLKKTINKSYNPINYGETMSGNVFILGSFNIDITSRVDRFPKPGETIISQSHTINVGGKGANQALASNNAGSSTHFVTKVGKDQFSHYAHSHLTSTGMHYILYETDIEPTGSAIIYVSDNNGENMVCISPGANLAISEKEVLAVEEAIDNADIILLQLEINYSALYKIIELANKKNKRIILNPAPYSSGVESILDKIDILTPNETEAEELTGIKINNIDDAKKALIALSNKGVKIPLITMGKKGAAVLYKNEFIFIPSYPAVAVDTTGAGDAFNGALASQLANNINILNAVKFACAFASLAVERQGAANMPTYEQTMQKIKQHEKSMINS